MTSCKVVVTRMLLYPANRYKADINRENPLGCEGQLAYCFAGLVRRLWTTEDDYIYPRNLRVSSHDYRVCVCVCVCVCVYWGCLCGLMRFVCLFMYICIHIVYTLSFVCCL